MIKRYLAYFMFAICLMFISGCGAAAKKSINMTEVKADIRVYEVFGMDCPACAGGLDKLVVKNPAIKKSDAQWSTLARRAISLPEKNFVVSLKITNRVLVKIIIISFIIIT